MEKLVIGIDIGGINTVFGAVNAKGIIIESRSILTGQYPTAEEFVDVLVSELNELIKQVGDKSCFRGIGVGAPCGNYYTGCVENTANMSWCKEKTVPLAKMITEATGLPTALTNDANAAAVGEMTYGAAKGMKNFIMITLGTGVGSGIVVNGQVVYGHDGFAGELGHVIIRRGGRPCGCGRWGCLETYTSATGVACTAREYLENDKRDSLLRNDKLEDITSKKVHEAAKQGDPLALDVFEFTGKILGEAFADFVTFTGPEAIILFGGLANAEEYIMKPAYKYMEANILSLYKGKTKLLRSQLKESDAAVLGASALGWEIKENS